MHVETEPCDVTWIVEHMFNMIVSCKTCSINEHVIQGLYIWALDKKEHVIQSKSEWMNGKHNFMFNKKIWGRLGELEYTISKCDEAILYQYWHEGSKIVRERRNWRAVNKCTHAQQLPY